MGVSAGAGPGGDGGKHKPGRILRGGGSELEKRAVPRRGTIKDEEVKAPPPPSAAAAAGARRGPPEQPKLNTP